MSQYWVDTEFFDNGWTIDLISIGIVSSDGREYYAQHSDFSYNPYLTQFISENTKWVKDNVFPYLRVCSGDVSGFIEETKKGLLNAPNENHSGVGRCYKSDCPWRTHEELKNEIGDFMDAEEHGKPELIGWCSGYDFVALCQLFGTMMDLPSKWPHYIRDLQYLLDVQYISDDELPQQDGNAHNALDDAHYIKKLWEYIVGK